MMDTKSVADEGALGPMPPGAAMGAPAGRQPDLRLLIWSAGALCVLCLASILPTSDTVVTFSGKPICLRTWMHVFNGVAAGTHLIALLALWAGVAATRRRAMGWSAAVQRGALVLLGASALATLAVLAFPLLVGSGPWPAESRQIAGLTVLCFAPSVLRAVGWALFATATLGWGRVRVTPWSIAVVGLFWVDVALDLYCWSGTAIAVFMRLHPAYDSPLWMGLWALAFVALLAPLARRGAPA